MVKLRIVSKRDPVGSALQIPKTRRGRVPGCVPPLPPSRCHRVTVPLSSWCGQGSVAKAFPRTGSGSKRQEQLGQLAGHLLQRRRLRPTRFPSPKRPPPRRADAQNWAPSRLLAPQNRADRTQKMGRKIIIIIIIIIINHSGLGWVRAGSGARPPPADWLQTGFGEKNGGLRFGERGCRWVFYPRWGSRRTDRPGGRTGGQLAPKTPQPQGQKPRKGAQPPPRPPYPILTASWGPRRALLPPPVPPPGLRSSLSFSALKA